MESLKKIPYHISQIRNHRIKENLKICHRLEEILNFLQKIFKKHPYIRNLLNLILFIMCIELALKKGGIGILKNFMLSTRAVYRFFNKWSSK